MLSQVMKMIRGNGKSKAALGCNLFIICILLLVMILLYIPVNREDNLLLVNNYEGFRPNDLSYFNNNQDINYTFEKLYQASVSLNGNQKNITVSATNASYAYIQEINLLDGRFFTEDETTNSHFVCVISESLAWHFFGDDTPIGQTLEINNVQFLVMGVYKKRPWFINNQQDNVFIPYSAADSLYGDIQLKNVIFHTEQKNISLLEESSLFAAQTQKNADTFQLINLSFYMQSLYLKPVFIICIIAVIALFFMLKMMMNHLSIYHYWFLDLLQQHYLRQILQKYKKELIFKLWPILIYLLFIMLLVYNVVFLFGTIDNLNQFSFNELGINQTIIQTILAGEIGQYILYIMQLHTIVNILCVLLSFCTMYITVASCKCNSSYLQE